MWLLIAWIAYEGEEEISNYRPYRQKYTLYSNLIHFCPNK